MSHEQKPDYADLLKDEDSLMLFLRNVREFDQAFTDMIVGGMDFTLRLEVRGNKGKMVHCRVSRDYFERPEK